MFSVEQIIQSGGLLLIGLIIFAESGLLAGFFLPGDTLLFSAGFFAAEGKLPLVWLMVVAILAAIIGDNVGYSIGKRFGPRIFRKKDGIFFRHEYIAKSEAFYEKHGGKTIILARFTPLIRTFAPVVAGVGSMSRKRFMLFNTIGGTLWCVSIILLGYALGNRIHNIDKYIFPVLGLVVLLSFGSALFHLFGNKAGRQLLAQKLRKAMKRP